jgi:cell shape-determining protein MreC
LISAHNALKKDHQLISDDLSNLEQENQALRLELKQWKEMSEELKMANAMLGSDQYKRETKLKINALVRDIEQCIAHLAP